MTITLKDALIGIVVGCISTVLIFSLLLGAVLQQSYRMNPPTAEEIADDPSLERYLP